MWHSRIGYLVISKLVVWCLAALEKDTESQIAPVVSTGVLVWACERKCCMNVCLNVAYTKNALWVFRIAKQQVSASPFIILMVVSFIHICVRLSHNKLVFHGVLALWSLKSWPVTWNQPVLLAQGDYFYLLWPHYLITWLCLMWVSTLNIGEKIWKLSRSALVKRWSHLRVISQNMNATKQNQILTVNMSWQ